jgi:hypothetical protein
MFHVEHYFLFPIGDEEEQISFVESGFYGLLLREAGKNAIIRNEKHIGGGRGFIGTADLPGDAAATDHVARQKSPCANPLHGIRYYPLRSRKGIEHSSFPPGAHYTNISFKKS